MQLRYSTSTKLEDFITDDDEFEELLDLAMANARSDRAEEFCSDLEEKFEKYGLKMFMSQSQWNWLERLADDD